MITLLDRYIAKHLWDYLFLGLVIFTLVLFFSDALLDFMKDLQHYGIPWDIALTLIGLQIPRIVSIVIPMSALLSALIVYNNLNNQFELIAMRMSGISLYRLSMPAIILGLCASLFAYILIDYVVPTCNKYARDLKTFAINQQNLPATNENFIYKQFDKEQDLKRLIYVSHFDGNRLGASTVVDLTNPATLQVIQAKSGLWGRSVIELSDANVYTVAFSQKLTNTTHASQLQLQHFIQPQVSVSEYAPREMSFVQLYQWIQRYEQRGRSLPRKVYVTLWEKLTVPLNSLALVLIAVPLALTAPRKLSNLGFLGAVLILLTYYVLRHIAQQLGMSGMLLPFLAACLPLVIIFTTAILLFRHKNKVL